MLAPLTNLYRAFLIIAAVFFMAATAQAQNAAGGDESPHTNESGDSVRGHTFANNEGAAPEEAAASVAVIDNDDANIILTPTQMSLAKGLSSTFTVKLSREPQGEVPVYFNTEDLSRSLSVPSDRFIFNNDNWDTEQAVTISAHYPEVSSVQTPDPIIVTATAEGGDYDGKEATISVEVQELITTSSDVLDLYEGGVDGAEGDDTPKSGIFVISLNQEPDQDVTLRLVRNGDVDSISVSPETLMFTTSDWDTAKTVTISAQDDGDSANETINIDIKNGDLSVKQLTVSVEDDDTPEIILTPLPGNEESTANEGETTTFVVKLSTIPQSDVTVEMRSDYRSVESVSPVNLTFTSNNYNEGQTVDVKIAADDDLADHNISLSASASSNDHDYAGKTSALAIAVKDLDEAAVLVTPSLTIEEGGAEGTFEVKLSHQPSGRVTVSISSESDAIDTIEPNALTFKTGNWNTVQVVTVKSAGEDTSLGDRTATVTATATGGGFDGNEVDGPVKADVTVTVKNVSTPALVLSTDAPVAIRENGDDVTFTVKLGFQPTGNVEVAVASDDTTAVRVVSSPLLTFNTENWNTEKTVILSTVDDEDGDSETVAISLAPTGGGYGEVANAAVTVKVVDDSAPGVTLIPEAIPFTVDEGGTRTFTVSLNTQPANNVTVTISSDNQAVEVMEGSRQLTFKSANYNEEQTVTIAGIEDNNLANETVTLTANLSSDDEGYNALEGVSLQVETQDNDQDSAAILITSDSDPLSIDEGGGTGELKIRLSNQPSGEVTVSIASEGDAIDTIEPNALTFNAGNWDEEQTVTLTSGAEDVFLSDRTATVTATATGGGYDDEEADVTVTVANISEPSLALSTSEVAIRENGDDATFTVKLGFQPMGDVEVAVASDDTTIVEVTSSPSLTFTTSNWNTEQTITLSVIEDPNAIDEEATISLNPTGGGFGEAANATVVVRVTDDDTPGATLIHKPDTFTIPDRINMGETEPFAIKLNTQPAADVTVTIGFDSQLIESLSQNTFTFTPDNYDVEQTLMITAVRAQDDIPTDGVETILTATFSSDDDDYSELTEQQLLEITIYDNIPRLSANVTDLSIREGRTGTFTVRLMSLPSVSPVTISIASSGESDESVVTVTPETLTFNGFNWDTPQKVTVTASDTIDPDGASATLTLKASSPDASEGNLDYNEAAPISISVTVKPAVEGSDTGAAASSTSNSLAVGAQMGGVIANAGFGGLSAGGGTSAGSGNEAQGVNTGDYGRLYVLSSRIGDGGFSLVDWLSMGISNASVDAALQGSGTSSYAMGGSELSKTADKVSGLVYGLETSNWTYASETDVQKTGLSVGYYQGERVGSLILTGSAILTLITNSFDSDEFGTGNASSTRVLLTGALSGNRDLEDGSSLSPYASLLYASENTGAFTFSDNVTASQAGQSSIGKISLGVEYTLAPQDYGLLLFRGELGQVFGAKAMLLNDGVTTYTPNKNPTGSLTVGWIGDAGEDSTARVELTIGEIGNADKTETRLDGNWDRQF